MRCKLCEIPHKNMGQPIFKFEHCLYGNSVQ